MFLVEISVPGKVVRDIVMRTDPLVASDREYAIKTYLAAHDVKLRPWTWRDGTGDVVRIVGWSAAPHPPLPDGARVGHAEFSIVNGQRVRMISTLCAMRHRHKGRDESRRSIYTDAADGADDPKAAYEAWAAGRFAGIQNAVDLHDLRIEGVKKQRLLRKVARGSAKIVREILMPVLTVVVDLTVNDADAFIAWLGQGSGPGKAFGFGGFFPC